MFTWHEAADVVTFHPPAQAGVRAGARAGAVWIGNWGDGERTAELEGFLLAPTDRVGLPLDVYGVRYPDEARGDAGPAWGAVIGGGCRTIGRPGCSRGTW